MEQRDLWILLFLLACCLSTALSSQASFLSLDTGRYEGLFTWLMYGVILFFVSKFGVPHTRYLYVFAAAYGFCCAVALLQLMGKNPLWLYLGTWNYYSPFIQESGAFLGTLGNVDVFSALHCLALPLFLSAAVHLKSRTRFLLLFPVALGLLCVLLARVSSGILALAVTIFLYAPQWADQGLFSAGIPDYCIRKKIRLILRIVLIGILFLFLLLVYFLPPPTGTLYELYRILHGDIQDHFGSHRILIWRKALLIISEHPVLGIGPDCSLEYFNICFSKYSDVFEEVLYRYVDNAHNEYLQLLINFGLVGCFPLFVFLCRTLWLIFRNSDYTVLKIMSPGFICYLIQAFFNIGSSIVVPFFLILWGMLLRAQDDAQLLSKGSAC